MARHPERRMPSAALAGVSFPGRPQEGTLAEHRGFERELDDESFLRHHDDREGIRRITCSL
jgi:hypothetical protein